MAQIFNLSGIILALPNLTTLFKGFFTREEKSKIIVESNFGTFH
jgi:hypothetical protein